MKSGMVATSGVLMANSVLGSINPALETGDLDKIFSLYLTVSKALGLVPICPNLALRNFFTILQIFSNLFRLLT